MKKIFVKFLKDRRLYSAFIRNLNNHAAIGWCTENTPHRCLGCKSGINHYLDSHDKYQWVGAGFIWSATDQAGIWYKLNGEWKDLLEE